jgi:hypothetical protein
VAISHDKSNQPRQRQSATTKAINHDGKWQAGWQSASRRLPVGAATSRDKDYQPRQMPSKAISHDSSDFWMRQNLDG